MVSQRVNLFRVACHPHLTRSRSRSSPFPGLPWPRSSCRVAASLPLSAPERWLVQLQSKESELGQSSVPLCELVYSHPGLRTSYHSGPRTLVLIFRESIDFETVFITPITI